MVTQASMPSVCRRMALTFSETSRDLGCDAPSGKTVTMMA